MPERDMLSLGVMGMGAGGLRKFFRRRRRRRRRRRPPPKSRVFGEIISLRFLTHMRATDAKPPYK